MDEDLSIINANTRNEKIKNFFVNNKKLLISSVIILVLIVIGVYSYDKYTTDKKRQISDNFNAITIDHSESSKDITLNKLLEIINQKDPTYSPLSLYFIIDNNLLSAQSEVNKLFDVIIDETSLDKEIKNLVIYKKALFNADQANEADLLNMLNPLINSESVWKSHALLLMADYFEHNNNLIKSKDFLEEIVNYELVNNEIKIEAERRLKRNFGD